MDREQYEKDLAKRQQEHLDRIYTPKTNFSPTTIPWRPCMHDQCTECHGTGIKLNGQACVHGISCPCPKCSFY